MSAIRELSTAGSTTMSATAVPPARRSVAELRRLYFVRFMFAAVWAGVVAGVGSSIDAATVTLLILYSVFDVAAAIVDLRATRDRALYVNIAISAAAASVCYWKRRRRCSLGRTHRPVLWAG